MFSSQIDSLDKIFFGGLQNGIITEISGLRGTGKTQLSLQFAIEPLVNNKKILFQKILNQNQSSYHLMIITLKLNMIKKSYKEIFNYFNNCSLNGPLEEEEKKLRYAVEKIYEL